MKRSGNGRRRLLSLVLSLVLVVGLMPVISLPASAADDNIQEKEITGITSHSDGSLASITFKCKFVHGEPELGAAYGKFALHSSPSTKQWDWFHPYYGGDFSSQTWPSFSNTGESVVAVDGNSFRWTKDYTGQTKTFTMTFSQGAVPSNGVYYLYMWSMVESGGVYPDTFFARFKVVNGVWTSDNDETAPAPTHAWNTSPVTTGNGTSEAVTTLTCICGTQIRVSLTASNVTLPGNAFSAKINVEEILPEVAVAAYSPRAFRFAAPQLSTGHGLMVSDTPGYKYSPDGTNFTDIDSNTFTPQAGFYQASILVNDANGNQIENLYVKYTVSDPAVTAATGDNRPIEMMVMGMAFFSALAIAAFVLDSRRRGSR